MSEADGMWVEVDRILGLDGVLYYAGVRSRIFVPHNEPERLEVLMDAVADARLEAMIAKLAELRWRYDPGRTLQMVLPGVMEGQAPAEGRLGLPVQDGEEVGE